MDIVILAAETLCVLGLISLALLAINAIFYDKKGYR